MSNLKELFHHCERGFNLIEILILALIIGIIEAVILPNVTALLNTANLSSANTEANAVRTAADASYSEAGNWPKESNNLASDGFLDWEPKEIYSFYNTDSLIDDIDSTGKWIEEGLSFNVVKEG